MLSKQKQHKYKKRLGRMQIFIFADWGQIIFCTAGWSGRWKYLCNMMPSFGSLKPTVYLARVFLRCMVNVVFWIHGVSICVCAIEYFRPHWFVHPIEQWQPVAQFGLFNWEGSTLHFNRGGSTINLGNNCHIVPSNNRKILCVSWFTCLFQFSSRTRGFGFKLFE